MNESAIAVEWSGWKSIQPAGSRSRAFLFGPFLFGPGPFFLVDQFFPRIPATAGEKYRR
jgi:hypothetical protein